MVVELQNISKRYRYEWIFRGVAYSFRQGGRYAVTGPNGSGKSTLLKVLSGHLTPSRGTILFRDGKEKIRIEDVYRKISYAAPYIELIEEFTLREMVELHRRFRPLVPGMTPEGIFDLLAFSKARNKEIRHFSSGMKQRLKLALAFCSSSSLLLLDEPTTNLDKQGVDWYLDGIAQFAGDRTVVVASNMEVDYGFCEEEVGIMDYK